MARPALLALLPLLACFPGRTTTTDEGDDTALPADTADTADTQDCRDPDGDCYTLADGDCDEGNPDVHPGAAEACNDVDDDCDGQTDEDAGGTYYTDADDDGYGDLTSTLHSCDAPEGAVDNGADCADDDPERHPGADEVANKLDDDCDGEVDEGVPDVATLGSVDVTFTATGVEVRIDGSAAGWSFGIAETGVKDAGWYGESCIPGGQPRGYDDYGYDLCHDLGATGGTLTRVFSVGDLGDGDTLFGDQIDPSSVTFFLISDDGSACWAWGDSPGYYSAYGCSAP